VTYEQAQAAARERKRVLHKLPLGGISEYTATDAARHKRNGKTYESLRLEDSTGCVVIAAVKDCEVKG
jgi:hypothetical protein